MSKRFAPAIKKSGAVYIDNSSAFRMDPDVPLVVPEINGEDALAAHGIISNPNCSTIITAMAIGGIAKLSPIEKMVVCTYQAVSGAGRNGLLELENQMKALAEGGEVEHKVFPTQIALNVSPFIGSLTDNDYTDEEMKMQNEGRKIHHLPELKVTCACVRVPVMRSHSIAVTLRTERKISVGRGQRSHPQFPRLPPDRGFRGPQLSHPAGHQRPGSGLGRPCARRPDRRQGPDALVLRRPDPQGRCGQRRADPAHCDIIIHIDN